MIGMKISGLPIGLRIRLIFCLAVFGCLGVPITATAAPEDMTPEQMNDAIGLPLWSSEDLWTQSAADTAARLPSRLESDTGVESVHLVSADKVFGVPPENIKITGKNGTVADVLIMFANKGDTLGMAPDQRYAANPREYRQALAEFRKKELQLARVIRQQSDSLEQTLTTLLGPYRKMRFGEGHKTTELVKAWQWSDHVFLLSEQKDASLSLRIVPAVVAENRGKAPLVTDADLQTELQTRILRRENGDVVITGIPMIDQGDKGYCVPSTWARYLRYMGIPADEYMLANAAGTTKGGGTHLSQMLVAVNQLVKQNRRSIKTLTGRITVDQVARYINKGLPLMWGMYVVGPFTGYGYPAERMAEQSPEAWSASLKEARRAAKSIKVDTSKGHTTMIIGYNAQTGEIAISDSWGLRHAEKWHTIEEAQAVSQNELYVVSW
ncbi:MAG: C39 family peptidase [Kiritimatiellia bacterium]|jgi:hypothetical protein